MVVKLDAVLWDYDGTMVNSVPKNINITKEILSTVAPRLTGANLPRYLKSEAAYHEANHAAKNWQELYTVYYGMTESEMLEAGALWAEHQNNNQTEAKLFPGIEAVIKHSSHIPHGVCSQNSQANILNVLKEHGVHEPFKSSIVGYEDVPIRYQKPHPFGGIKCLSKMFSELTNKVLMYIGDHEADVKFARNIELELGKHSKVISVAVTYSGANPRDWGEQPDSVASNALELISIIEKYT